MKPMKLTLKSAVFNQGDLIPRRNTCEGEDLSPPLQWEGAPSGTKSFALIMDDPDAPDPEAPKMTWVHWVLYNIPVAVHSIAEASTAKDISPQARDGLNDRQKAGYHGPCPPIGKHRYFFKLYALDTVLRDLGKPTKAELEKAMLGHVLEKTELMGTYQKER